MSSSRVMTNGVQSPRRNGRACSQNSQSSRGGNSSRRNSAVSCTTAVESLVETTVPPVTIDSASTRTVVAMMPCNREMSYGNKLAHSSFNSASANMRGISKERGVRTASTGRGVRSSSSANSSVTSTTIPANVTVSTMAPPSTDVSDTGQQSHWEQFVAHRHETQLKLEALVEARESQRLTDARAQMQVEHLSCTVGQDVQAIREQSDSHLARLIELDRALESDREALETIRRGLGRLERALRDQVEQQEQHQEAVAATIKRGDRVVADELLAKMAELNEKLGANMQALEEEVTRDLQMMKEQISEGNHAASSDIAVAVSPQDNSHHFPIAVTQISTAELSLACMMESKEDVTSTTASSLPENLMQEVQCQRTKLEELDSKLAAEIAIFRDSRLALAREQRNFSEQLREGLDDVRQLCNNAETISASSSRTMREELHARLDEARNAREDFAAAVEESLREMREELQQKIESLNSSASFGELLESLRGDLRSGLDETWQAQRDLALSVESSARELEGIRAEVSSATEKSREVRDSLAGTVDKAISALRDEFAEQLISVRNSHDELSVTIDRKSSTVHAELGEGMSMSQYVADVANGTIGPLRNELDDLRSACSDLTTHAEQAVSALRDELAEQFQSVKNNHAELSVMIDRKISTIRGEFGEGKLMSEYVTDVAHGTIAPLRNELDDLRSTCSDLATHADEAVSALRDELSEQLNLLTKSHDELSIMIDRKVSTVCGELGEGKLMSEYVADIANGTIGPLQHELDDLRCACSDLATHADEAVSALRDELAEQLTSVKNGHDELSVMIDRRLSAIPVELCEGKLMNEYVADVASGAIGPLQTELKDLRCACSDLATHAEEACSKLQSELSEERDERLKLAELLKRCVPDVQDMLDQAVIGFRGEFKEGVERSQEITAGLRSTLSTLDERLSAETTFRDEALNQLRQQLLLKLQEREGDGCHGAKCLAQSQEFARCLEQSQEFLGKLEDMQQKCDNNQEDMDAIKQKMQKFFEEIIGMVTDINNQACCGCIDVQQSLEVAVERLSGVSDEVLMRVQALEQHPVVAASSALGKNAAVVEESVQIASAAVPDKGAYESASQGERDEHLGGDTAGRLDALEARMEALSGTLQQDAERFEAWLKSHATELAALPSALGDSRGKLCVFEEQLEFACVSMQKDKVKLEQTLGHHETRLETVAATVGKMRAQLDMSEARLEAACKAAQNTSMNSSPIRWEREVSDCDLVASPTTYSEAQGHIATLQDRLDTVQETTRRHVACLDSRLEIVEAGLRSLPTTVTNMQSQFSKFEAQLEAMSGEGCCKDALDGCSAERCKAEFSVQALYESIASHDKELRAHAVALESLSESCSACPQPVALQNDLEAIHAELSRLQRLESVISESSLQDKVVSLEEQLSAVSQRVSKEQMQLDRRLETHTSDVAGIRRTLGDLTNDVLKTQGLADAAYAEATREQDWTSAIMASAKAVREQCQAEMEKACDAAERACSKLKGDMHETTSSSMQQMREELQQQCRSWIHELSREAEKTDASSQGMADGELMQTLQNLRGEWQNSLEECVSEIARNQAHNQELLRSEIEQSREEAQAEGERLREAIGAQAGGIAERSEALAQETQRQCRIWVDGALRKLEDLAVRTKERIAALASAADRREERLEARLAAKFTDVGLLKTAEDVKRSVDD